MDVSASADNILKSLSPDAFMTLFLTQVKHQDPTEPLDPSQMMSQLAELTNVQQLDALNKSFQSALQTEQLGLARGLIGTQVTYAVGEELRAGVVEGAAVADGDVGVYVGTDFVPLGEVMEILGSAS